MSAIRNALKGLLSRLHMLKLARRLLGRPAPDPAEPPFGHGHDLFVRLLSGPTSVPAGYVIEIGTTREKLKGQGSTLTLARLAARNGRRFVTVDMDPANTAQARRDLAGIPTASATTSKGEDFLQAFTEPVAAAYLDAFDIQHGQHSEYRVARYRELLGTEISNEGAAEMHRACAEALLPRMAIGGLIVIDDTWPEGASYVGKGATAVPLLLLHGFEIVGRTRTAVGLQRVGHLDGR